MSFRDLIIIPPNPPKLISRKNFVPVLTSEREEAAGGQKIPRMEENKYESLATLRGRTLLLGNSEQRKGEAGMHDRH